MDRRRALRLARWPAGLALLGLVVSTTDFAGIARALDGVVLVIVVPAVAGLVAIHVVAALTWRMLVREIAGVDLPLLATIRIAYAAQALGGITPANLGGDVYRASLLRTSGHGWRSSTLPIVLQRATSYLALSGLGIGAVGVLTAAGVGGPVVVVGLAAAGGVGVVALLLVVSPALVGRILGRVIAMPKAVDGGTDRRALTRRAGAVGVLGGLLFHAGSVGLTWAILVGVDPSLAVPVVGAALVIARLTLAVPVSPSGLGLQEGVLAVLVSAAGGSVAAAVAGMLLARIALLVTTLVGAAAVAGPSIQLQEATGQGEPAPSLVGR